MRTLKQVMADRLLLLYAIARANEYGCIDGPFKLMKIPFMAELRSTAEGVNTFNYRFYRYTYGPFTTEIYEDGDALWSLGLASNKSGPSVQPTQKGRWLLDSAADLYRENAVACSYVEDAARKYVRLGFNDLKRKIYAQTIVAGDVKVTVGDAPTGMGLLKRVPNPKAEFQLNDDWIDSLWGVFHYTDEEHEMAKKIRPFKAAVTA